MATRQLRVEIVGDPRRIMRTFDSIDRSAGRMARGFSRATTLVGAGLAAMAGGAVISAIKSMVDEAREAEKVGRQTAAVIKATGGVAKVSAKDVDRLATALSNKVGVDDEIIAAGQNMLLTFKGVRNELGKGNDIFNQTTRVALDMTAALNQGEVSQQGLEQTTMRLGKALNDPIKGISALTRVGVTFTDAQKEQIRTLVESGRTMDAQKIILKELATKFGGAAEAAADPWQRLGVVLGNIKERVGAALLPFLQRAADIMVKDLIPAAERWWKEHGPKVRDIFSRIAHIVGVVWDKLKNELWPEINRGAEYLRKNLSPELDKLNDAWRDNSKAITGLKEDLKPLIDNFFPILAFLVKGTAEEVRGLIGMVGWLGRAWEKVKGPILTVVHALVREVLAGFGQILRGAANAFGWVPNVGEKLRRAADSFDKFQQDVNTQFRQIISGKTISLAVRGMVSMPGAPRGTELLIEKGIRKARGGPIRGPGTTTSDSIPAMLSAGEHVLSAREVAGMGGHAAVEAMRRTARGFAAGGGVTVSPDIPGAGAFGAASTRMIDRIVASTARVFANNIVARIPGVFPPHVAGGWRMATQFLGALGIPYSVISSFRPGARTRASGSVSYHALNRAVDIAGPNMLRIFEALARTNPTELIYSGADRYKSRRGWRPIGALDPITLADHWSHVHAAYDRGGWLPPGVSVAVNRTGRAERVLGPGEGGLTVNFYGPVYGDRRALTEVVRQTWKEQLRREGKGALAAQL